jgi:hypothetical protein
MTIEYPIAENTGAFANIEGQELQEFTRVFFNLFKVSFKTAFRKDLGRCGACISPVCLTYKTPLKVGSKVVNLLNKKRK